MHRIFISHSTRVTKNADTVPYVTIFNSYWRIVVRSPQNILEFAILDSNQYLTTFFLYLLTLHIYVDEIKGR